jgi:hypothetical protein
MSAAGRTDPALSRNPKPPPFRRWRIHSRPKLAARPKVRSGDRQAAPARILATAARHSLIVIPCCADSVGDSRLDRLEPLLARAGGLVGAGEKQVAGDVQGAQRCRWRGELRVLWGLTGNGTETCFPEFPRIWRVPTRSVLRRAARRPAGDAVADQ